jgi:hypothetical protein
MKRNFVVFATALVLLVTTAASAETLRLKVDVNVPFSFIVNRDTLPAGEYRVESMGDGGRILSVRGLNSKTINLVSPIPCASLEKASQTKLIFHRYGDQYFLTRIWVSGNTDGDEIPASPREKELAKGSSMRQVAVLASKR